MSFLASSKSEAVLWIQSLTYKSERVKVKPKPRHAYINKFKVFVQLQNKTQGQLKSF